MRLRNKYDRIRFFEEWLSASEIARRHGLSVPTILRRHAQGLTGRELVALPGALPRAADGHGFVYRSQRFPTVLQAATRLRRAKEAVEHAIERLAHGRALGENNRTMARLKRELVRAEMRRMYATTILQTVEALKEEDAA